MSNANEKRTPQVYGRRNNDQQERNWQSLGIGVVLLLMGGMGSLIISILLDIKLDVSEVKVEVQKVDDRVHEIEKKLVAVVINNGTLRKTVDKHLDRAHNGG
jgi:hypothetical protein